MMEYVTHKRDDGTFQQLIDHLKGVAERASMFADAFSAAEHGKRTGMLHDIGKYSQAAQRRQRDPENVPKIDHSTAGACVAMKMRDTHAAFAVAGHHGGLPDPGSVASPDASTLLVRLSKPLTGNMDCSAWQSEVHVNPGDLTPTWLKKMPGKNLGFANALYTRMLFSCLVDADYLDTEAYMSCETAERCCGESLSVLLEKLRDYTASWLAYEGDGINQIRTGLLRRCLQGDQYRQGLYTLTIPTGGGKTVSSLAFALSHAQKHGLSRVIYVVPYTSIIEQNAEVFRDILGSENVLEHHANVDVGDDADAPLRLAAENWDAPVIVTTAVQFFESLFAARTSRCRKLHNIANAVVIFDEAQMIPVPYLRPCVNAIAELVQHYGATAVLCTATQPALGCLVAAYAPELSPVEICPGTEALFASFRRTCIVQEGMISQETLLQQIEDSNQALCIVNTRKTAQELYERLPMEGRFHLSTLMTPRHRARTLAEIRHRLSAGKTCRVVSTSLIEAGVDVDFPAVWREIAGLDSILQAAGRCNREGKHPVEESLVHVFRLDGKVPQMIRQNVAATEYAIRNFSDIASPASIQAYFSDLLFLKGEQALDVKGILLLSDRQCFRTIGKEFRLIEEETIPVYIPSDTNEELLMALRAGDITRSQLRVLGKDAVNVRPQHFQALMETQALDCPWGSSFGILLDMRQYDEACGLLLTPEGDALWIC